VAFPVSAVRTSTGITSAADPWTVNLPTGIVAGDLLVMMYRTAAAIAHDAGSPAGWTYLVDGSAADASDDLTSILYRRADGSEGTTASIGFASAVKGAQLIYRITGAENPAVQPPELSAIATGASATVDPTAVTPTGGVKDYLFLWLGAWEGEQVNPPATGPAGYSEWFGNTSGAAGAVDTNCRVNSGWKQAAAASEDGPAVTISVSDEWSAWTMAIHPAPELAQRRVDPVQFVPVYFPNRW
jgi:hypothetical protein